MHVPKLITVLKALPRFKGKGKENISFVFLVCCTSAQCSPKTAWWEGLVLLSDNVCVCCASAQCSSKTAWWEGLVLLSDNVCARIPFDYSHSAVLML